MFSPVPDGTVIKKALSQFHGNAEALVWITQLHSDICTVFLFAEGGTTSWPSRPFHLCLPVCPRVDI